MIKIKSFKKCSVAKDLVHDFALNIPNKKFAADKEPFGFLGWIVGKSVNFVRIEIFVNEQVALTIPINQARPEIIAKYPKNPAGDIVGFFRYMNPYYLPEKFDIEVYAVPSTGGRIKIFDINGDRKPIDFGYSMDTAPLVVTTLGRTGSTYTIAALGMHPDIVTYKPFKAEARYASFWAQMFFSLGDPHSWMCPLSAYDRTRPDWILGLSNSQPFHYGLYPQMFKWFQSGYFESLYKFSLENLQRHYQEVAKIEKKKVPMFFCEKFLPDYFTERMLSLIPSAKEVFLVRDFRDMFCSIRAFNNKRGFNAFGRQKYTNNVDYISEALRNSVNRLLSAWSERQNTAFLLKYEDLIMKPELVLNDLFEYLGVDSSPAIANKMLKNINKLKPSKRNTHVTSKSQKYSVARFKKELNGQLLEICNEAFEPALTTFGYNL